MRWEMAARQELRLGSPTACVSGGGAGWDSAWEQKKPEARKMLENAAESPPSTARFVGRLSFYKAIYRFERGNSITAQ
jgi:hypothetical protein